MTDSEVQMRWCGGGAVVSKGLFWMIAATTWVIRRLVWVENRHRTGGDVNMERWETSRKSNGS